MRVIDSATGEKLLLSNNHVFAFDTVERNGASVGKPIIQPGTADGGNTTTDRIATLLRWIKIKETGVNTIDCALARPLNAAEVRDDILEVGVPNAIGDPVVGMAVRKSGRTTGLTNSSVLDVNATITVGYGLFVTTFEDQIIINNFGNWSFGAPGDSGSVVLNSGLTTVGLLFAGSPSIIVANKMKNVSTALGFRLGVAAAGVSLEALATWLGAQLVAVGLVLGTRRK